MHIFKIFLLTISTLLVLHAQEGTRFEKVKYYHGYGSSKTSAVQNALLEAVKQTKGVYISSVKKLFHTNSNQYVSSKDDSASLTKMKTNMLKKIKVATAGFIDNYEILNIKKDSDGYDAKIKIVTVEYKTPGNSAHKRRKIIIVPAYTENILFKVLNHTKNPKDISYNLSQELTNDITKTRKFSVLDRNNKNAYNSEKALILSPDAQKEEILKLGQVLGTDYLVVTTIKEFKISTQNKIIQSNRKLKKIKAFATVNYQILTMATRQIKYSDTLDFEFTPKGHNEQQIFYNTLRKISKTLTNEIIENIYPIRISKISRNGDAILMQTSPLGTFYDVFKLGEKLYDPYTKEFLGYDEVKTGTIKIVRSLAKVSYGKVVNGKVQKNSICRKVKSLEKRQDLQKLTKADAKGKKSILINELILDSKINRYSRKYLKKTNIYSQIKKMIKKSNQYKIISQDDIASGYQLLPKITKFKAYTTSKKIPDIDAYENKDYIYLELNIIVLDNKDKVVFETTKSEKYFKSSSSEFKLKRVRPSSKILQKLVKKLISKTIQEFLDEQNQTLFKNLITVIEVGKHTIYLDLANNDDVQEGDIFPVYKKPTVRTLKRTKKTRLSYGEKIATVKIDGIYDDGVEAVVIKGKISNIKEGYVLRKRKRR